MTSKPVYNTWRILMCIYLCSQLQRNVVQSEFAFGSITDDIPPSPRLTEIASLFTLPTTTYWTGVHSVTLIRKEGVILLQGDILIA